MTDTLFSQSRTFLFGSNTRFQNRCDLKSNVGRCSGADLGFWDGFASVLDITLKHKTKVTIAAPVVSADVFQSRCCTRFTHDAGAQHHGLRKKKESRSNADLAQSCKTPCFKTTTRRIARVVPVWRFVCSIFTKSMDQASS